MGDEKLSSDTSDKLSIAGKLHFFVILLCLAMQVIELSDLYRFFAYLNLVFVLVLFPSTFNNSNRSEIRLLFYVLAIPIAFVISTQRLGVKNNLPSPFLTV